MTNKIGIVIGFLVLTANATAANLLQDSLRVKTTGESNQVLINNRIVADGTVATDTLQLAGSISQVGNDNSVQINTTGTAPDAEAPNRENQITNKSQKANYKTQPETRNLKPATIKIKQTGKNNSVKINSR